MRPPGPVSGLSHQVKGFPWRRRGVLVPAHDRRTAALGICLFTASNRTPLRVQRASFWAVRLGGTRLLPGRARAWTPPAPGPLWAELVSAWSATLGPIDALAVYQRRQIDRGGLIALLTHRGTPVAVVKLREDAASLGREQAALAAICTVAPTTFSAPLPLGAGSVSDEQGPLHWSAQQAVFTRPHRPVLDAPEALFDDVRRCLAAADGAAGEISPGAGGGHGELAHHDLTPWNLRRDHRGRRWLFDWEDWCPAPPDVDRAYYAATAHALAGRPMPTGLAEAGLRHWLPVLEQRRTDGPADEALRTGILAGIAIGLETASEHGRAV